MKTKLLILIGITMSVISAFSLAQNLASPWSTEISQTQATTVASTTDDVSPLLMSLQGIPSAESAYLDDDNVIYASRPNDLNEKTSRRKIASDAVFVFDQSDSKVLFAKKVKEAGEQNGWSTDLWVSNTLSGLEIKVSDFVSLAVISPSGKFIATENPATGGIELFNGDGVFLKKIGTFGVFPLFSPDSKKVAYYKFASASFTNGLLNDPLGIVIHDIQTGEEVLVTNSNEGGKPIAFSDDGTKVYFNSIRTSGNSLGVVSVLSHEVRQLPGNYDWRYFSVKKGVFVSSDDSAMVTSSESGIGVIMFNGSGEVSSVKVLAGGASPRWFKKDEIVAYRTQGNKGKYWEFISIK